MITEAVSYDLGELTVRGIAIGNESAPLMLCVHGWLDNAASFSSMLPFLSDYRVIAIDWPGHGLSDHRSQDAFYHFIDWVDDLLKLFELNKWQDIHLVGHSMGGMVASAFAAAFPEKVKTLNLIDSIGFVTTEAKESAQQLRKGLLSRLKIRNKSKSMHPTFESALTARLQVTDLNAEQVKPIVERGLEQVETGYYWRADSRLRLTSPYRLTPEQAVHLVSDISSPTHLIYGDKGMIKEKNQREQFVNYFQNITAQQLSGGHHLHIEHPEQVAKLIHQFICEN